MRISKGYQEFEINFNEAGTYLFNISSTHMKNEESIEVVVDNPKQEYLSNIEISSELYVYESFTINFVVSDNQGTISKCLFKLNPQIEVVSILNGMKYKLTGDEYCDNGEYSISNLVFNIPGDYKIIINSAISTIKILDTQITFKEIIKDADFVFPPTIIKNHPFELVVKLKSSTSTYYNPDASLIIESQSLYGQKSSKYTQGFSSFYIFSDLEGDISVKLKVLNSEFTKTFIINVQSSNQKELLINISPQSSSTQLSSSSDIFEVEIKTLNSIDEINYQIELYPIEKVSGLVIDGITDLNSKEEKIIFANLKILSQGTFLIICKASNGLIGISKETFSISNKILNLTIECNSEEPAFTEIYIIAFTFGEDGNYFIGDIEVDLNATNFHGSTTISTSNGIAIFKGYFSELISPIIFAKIKGTDFNDSTPLVVIDHEFEPIFEEIVPIVSVI